MSVDDRVRRGLEEVAPGDPSGAYERIVEKKVRRHIMRHAQIVVLTIVVIMGSAGGFAILATAFRSVGTPAVQAMTSNGVIAYTVRDATDTAEGGHVIRSRVFVVDPATGERRLVASLDGDVGGLDWSPDGQQLAFGLFPGEGVYVMESDGSRLRRIVDNGMMPAWSPDGRRLAYSGRDAEIHVIDVDGSNDRTLTDLGSATSPDWSPDGSSLAFAGPGPEGHRQGWDIYVMNDDGSNLVDLTNHPAVDLDPAWSPDGSKILFRSHRAMSTVPVPEDEFNERLYTIRPDGSSIAELTTTTTIAQSPVWSPDGNQIAFDDGAHVVVADADGSNRTQLTDDGTQPAWQPAPTAAGSGTPETESSVTPAHQPGEDVGLSFNLCGVRSLRHVDFVGDGIDGTAWTGAPVNDGGRCPDDATAQTIVTVDHTGDGRADDAWGPLEYCYMCRPYASTDLDGDGDDELVVLESGGSTPRFVVFDVGPTDADLRLRPIVVAAPGDARAGFPAGETMHVVTGGDEGFSGYVSCERYPERPEIVVAWTDGPVEGPGSGWRDVHVARLVTEHDEAHIIESSNDRATSDANPTHPFGADNVACGVDWNPL